MADVFTATDATWDGNTLCTKDEKWKQLKQGYFLKKIPVNVVTKNYHELFQLLSVMYTQSNILPTARYLNFHCCSEKGAC